MKASIILGIILVVAAVLIFAPSPTEGPGSGTAYAGSSLPGDANCDGVVNSIDAAFVLQFSAGLLSALPCSDNADANGDGGVSSLDAALVLQYAAGLITSLGGPPPPTTQLTRQDLVDYAHYLYCSFTYGGSGPWTVPICQSGITDCAAECLCIVNDMLSNFTLEQIAAQGLEATADYLAADVQWCLTNWLPVPMPTAGPGCDPIVGCVPGCDPVVGCVPECDPIVGCVPECDPIVGCGAAAGPHRTG